MPSPFPIVCFNQKSDIFLIVFSFHFPSRTGCRVLRSLCVRPLHRTTAQRSLCHRCTETCCCRTFSTVSAINAANSAYSGLTYPAIRKFTFQFLFLAFLTVYGFLCDPHARCVGLTFSRLIRSSTMFFLFNFVYPPFNRSIVRRSPTLLLKRTMPTIHLVPTIRFNHPSPPFASTVRLYHPPLPSATSGQQLILTQDNLLKICLFSKQLAHLRI